MFLVWMTISASSPLCEPSPESAVTVTLQRHVLTWDGDASAISRDSIQDTRQAKYKTVIDEWDEEFDSGKVKKLKNYKKEKWRGGSNIFQKIQDRRLKWSVTPAGKRAFGIRR